MQCGLPARRVGFGEARVHDGQQQLGQASCLRHITAARRIDERNEHRRQHVRACGDRAHAAHQHGGSDERVVAGQDLERTRCGTEELERQLGASVFDRTAGRLKLSPRGASLLPAARQILDLADEAARPTDELRVRHVTVAGFASAITSIVIPALGPLADLHVMVDVREEEDDEAFRELRLGHVDSAITQHYSGSAPDDLPGLSSMRLLTDRLLLIAPRRHRRAVRLEDLARAGWLVNGSGTRCEQATQHVLAASGLTPRITGRVGDNATLIALVAAGHGATVAPQLVVGRRRKDDTVASVDLGVIRTISAVTRTTATHVYTDVLTVLARSAAAWRCA